MQRLFRIEESSSSNLVQWQPSREIRWQRKIASFKEVNYIEKKNQVYYLEYWNFTEKSREFVDITTCRKVNIPCLHETKYKHSKSKNSKGGYKILYADNNNNRNGGDMAVIQACTTLCGANDAPQRNQNRY